MAFPPPRDMGGLQNRVQMASRRPARLGFSYLFTGSPQRDAPIYFEFLKDKFTRDLNADFIRQPNRQNAGRASVITFKTRIYRNQNDPQRTFHDSDYARMVSALPHSPYKLFLQNACSIARNLERRLWGTDFDFTFEFRRLREDFRFDQDDFIRSNRKKITIAALCFAIVKFLNTQTFTIENAQRSQILSLLTVEAQRYANQLLRTLTGNDTEIWEETLYSFEDIADWDQLGSHPNNYLEINNRDFTVNPLSRSAQLRQFGFPAESLAEIRPTFNYDTTLVQTRPARAVIYSDEDILELNDFF